MTPADLDAMTRTVWGEARGEEYEGKKAVAHVIINRWEMNHRREITLCGVATEPYQFSCWLPNDPNRSKMEYLTLNNSEFRICMMASLAAYIESIEGVDPTRGSTHYHTAYISPTWSEGHIPIVIIGDHKFYNDVK